MISRAEWEAKRGVNAISRERMFVRRYEEGANLTKPLLEEAINAGRSSCDWGGDVTLYNREGALGVLQSLYPEFKLEWYPGMRYIEIR